MKEDIWYQSIQDTWLYPEIIFWPTNNHLFFWGLSTDAATYLRDLSMYALSKWEMALHCNAISHWLGEYTGRSLLPTDQDDSIEPDLKHIAPLGAGI